MVMRFKNKRAFSSDKQHESKQKNSEGLSMR
jgi:hypothetical protein